METTIPAAKDGLHFYYEPRHLHPFNVGWLFPIGGHSRAGLGNYLGRTQLNETLASFTQDEFDCCPMEGTAAIFPIAAGRSPLMMSFESAMLPDNVSPSPGKASGQRCTSGQWQAAWHGACSMTKSAYPLRCTDMEDLSNSVPSFIAICW